MTLNEQLANLDNLAIVAAALEMWIGNEHDDIHEDPDTTDERRARLAQAESLFCNIVNKLDAER